MHHDNHIWFKYKTLDSSRRQNETSQTNKTGSYLTSRTHTPCLHISTIVFFLVLVLSVTKVVGAAIPAVRCEPCPSRCACVMNDGMCEINCASQPLSQVPHLSSLPEPHIIAKLILNGHPDEFEPHIISVSKEYFDNFRNLKHLDLGQHAIQYVDGDVFSSLSQLEFLSLADNQLRYIPANFLSHHLHLRTLNIRANRLRTLPTNFFDRLPSLSDLLVGENPFYCDCRLAWFQTWIQDHATRIISYQEIASIDCSEDNGLSLLYIHTFQDCPDDNLPEVERVKRTSRSCYDRLVQDDTIHQGGCRADDFVSCLYDSEANQWKGVEGAEFNQEITSLVECVAYCKREADHDAGFFETATTTCFCGDESDCSECESIDCEDGTTAPNLGPLTTLAPQAPSCDPPFQNGDEVCNSQYIANAFYVSAALELGGFEPFSSNSSSTISVSNDDDRLYQYTYDFGDGSEEYVSSENTAWQQFLMPGQHEMTIASSGIGSSLSVPVRVLDPPAGTTTSDLENVAGSEAAGITATITEGTDVQVKVTRTDADGTETLDATPCRGDDTYWAETESCYSVQDDRSTWLEAYSTCQAYGGWVVMPKTEAQNTYLVEQILDNDTRNIWLALTDANYEGTWFWNDTTQLLDDDAYWASDELDDNDGTKNCGHLEALRLGSGDDESSGDASRRRRHVQQRSADSAAYEWTLESCDEDYSVVCQYPAWGVHTVPKRLAGVPVSMSGEGAVREVAEDQFADLASTGTMLYLFPGSWFSHAGELHSWLVETASTSSDVRLKLQVYRPHCSDDRFLHTPGCGDAPYTICSSTEVTCPDAIDNCTSGHTYCPLTRTCLPPSEPCTCVNNAASCNVSTYPFEPIMYPSFTQIGTFDVTVPAENSAVLRMQVRRSIQVQAHDIIGVQIDNTDDLPIRCANLSADDSSPWRQQSYVSVPIDDWVEPGDVIEELSSSATLEQSMNCYIASTYTQPVTVNIPESLTSDLDDSASYSFSIQLFNTLGSININSNPLPPLDLLTPCTQTEPNGTCVLPTNEFVKFLFRIESETEYNILTMNYSDSVANFSHECPTFFENRTVCEVQNENYQYAFLNVTFTQVENIVLTFMACTVDNVCSTLVIPAILQRRIHVHRISSDYIYFDQPSQLSVDYTGEPADIQWNISGILYQDSESITHTFPEPNAYEVAVTVWNLLSRRVFTDTKYALDIFNGTNVTTDFPPIAALGYYVNLRAHAYFAPYTRGEFVFQFSDGGEEASTEVNHFQNTYNFVQGQVGYRFQQLGEQVVNVTLRDPLQSDFFDFTVAFVDVWHPIMAVLVNPNTTIVETGLTVVYTVTQINGTRNFTYSVDFLDDTAPYEHEETTDSVISFDHVFRSPGLYNVTALVENRVTSKTGFDVISVQDRILGLQLHYNGPTYIGNTTTILTTITNGTNVIYELFVSDNDTALLSQESGTFQLTFSLVGNYSIRVVARNGINSMEEEMDVEIRDLSEFVFHGILHDPCVPRSNADFTANVSYHDYSWLQFTWRFGDGAVYANTSLTYVNHDFAEPGSNWVSLEIESIIGGAVDRVETNSTVCVERRVRDVAFEPYEDQIGFEAGFSVSQNFTITVGRGTDYEVKWTYFGEDHITNSLTQEIEFNTAGPYDVTVTVSNHVSRREEAITVNVYEQMRGISVSSGNSDFANNGSLPTAQAYQLDFGLAEGSNVTWTVTQTDLTSSDSSETTGAGLTYQYINDVGEPSPTNVYFEVTASNPVSSMSLNFTIFFQEAIAGLSLTSNATEDESPVGDIVLFESSLTAGSHVHYTWTLVDPSGHRQTPQSSYSFITTVFDTVDTHQVTVVAANDISNATATVSVYVWQAYSVRIVASSESSPYYAIDEQVTFSVEYQDFQSPSYQWDVSDSSWNHQQRNGESMQHAFNAEGVYQVSVTLREQGNHGEDELTVYAQHPIVNLTLHPEESTDTYLQNDTVFFVTNIDHGTNVTYAWQVSDLLESTHDSSSSGEDVDFDQVGDNRASYIFTTPGRFRITAIGSNGVSEEAADMTVVILEAVRGVEIQGCCGTSETGEQVQFSATVQAGSNVQYNWTIGGTAATGQEQTFIPQDPGNYSIGVTAANQLSHATVYDTLVVLNPIVDVTLTRDIQDLVYYETNGLNITFFANVTGSHLGPLTYTWYVFIAEQNVSGSAMTLQLEAGWYQVHVEVTSALGDVVRDAMLFEVIELQCEPPVQALIGSEERRYLKSDSFKIEVSVQGCVRYAMSHQWTIYQRNCTPGLETEFPTFMARNTPTLTFEGRSMDYGLYCLRLTSTFDIIPVSSSTQSHIHVFLEIDASSLKAIIDGGSARTLANTNPVLIDGSRSYDPDSSTNSQQLTYTWFCSSSVDDGPLLVDGSEDDVSGQPLTTASPDSDYCDWIQNQTSRSFEVEENRLLSGYEYNFTLVVDAPNRHSGVFTQRVVVREATVPIVSINCVSCIESNIFTVSRRQHIKLIGSCEHCPGARYQWEVMEIDGDIVSLDETNTNTGTESPNLSIHRGVLEDNREYSFSLSVSAITSGTGRSTGMASLILESSVPPSNGTCTVILPNNTIVALEDTFTVECRNWQDNSRLISALTYHIYVQSGDNTDNWYPIYRGTSSSVTSFLSTQDGESTVDLYVEVIDESDASTLALHQVIAVVDAVPSENMTRTEYIAVTSMQTLAHLQVQNDPKILLQYMIAANLQLNAESSRSGTPEDEETRVLVRRQMLYTLNNTRTISAIDDIQQVAYVLRLLTTHLDEFPVSLDMFEISLELMYIIVQSLIDEVSPAMTGEEFVPNYMVTSVSNLMEIIWTEVIAHGNSNASVIRFQKMAVNLTNSVTMLALGTQLVEEQPVTYDTGYISISGQRVFGSDIQTLFDDGANQVAFVEDLMEDNREDELFQVSMSFRYNPYEWGFNASSRVTSRNVLTYFSHPNGDEISVNQLEDSRRVRMLLGQETTSEAELEATYVELKKDEVLSTKVDISSSDIPDLSSITIIIGTVPMPSDNVTVVPQAIEVNAYLKEDAIPHADNYDEMQQLVWDSDIVQFFIFDSFHSSSGAQNYYLTLENTGSNDVNVSVTMYATTCQYYDLTSDVWSNAGCEPHPNTTWTESYCLCNHMTMFASSVLVSPAELDFADLFRLDVENNPLAIILVCVLTAIYIGVAIVAKRWDILDETRTSVVPLCGVDGPHKYEITLVTGKRKGAGTSAHVGVKLYGKHGKSGHRHLQKLHAFQRSSVDTFLIATDVHLGDLSSLVIWHDNTGLDPNWYLSRVMVRNIEENRTWYFLAKCWLTVEEEGGCLQKQLRPADEHEKSNFRTLLSEEATKGLTERHLWISLFERPARNRFTRFQRATVCITVLFVFMFLNAMWYGLLHESPDKSDVNKQEYVQWVDVLVGMLAALITFPIAVFLIQFFKRVKPADQITPQNFKVQEEIELDLDIDSRVASASTIFRPQIPPPLHRMWTDTSSVSGESFAPSQAKPLKRTGNVMGVASFSTAKPLSSGSSSKGSSSSGKMWNEDTILQRWHCKPNSSHVQFHPHTHRRSAGSRRSRTLSTDSYDELMDELDEIEELYADDGPTRHKSRFNPRQDPSVVDLSMGSLGNISDVTSIKQSAPSRKISHVSHDTTLEDVHEDDPGDYYVPIQNIDGLQPGYEPQGLSAGEPPVHRLPLPPQHGKSSWELPHRCIYIAYALCFILYAVSAVCILLYGHEFGKGIALKWLTACFMSFLNSFLILEPLKVIVIALIVAKITDNIEGCEERLSVAPVLQSNETIKDIKMRPLAGYALLQAKEEGRKVVRMREMMRNFIAFMLFLLLVMIVNYASYNRLAIYQHRHVNSTFTVEMYNNDSHFRDILSYEDYWDWLEQVAAPGIHARDLQLEAEHGYVLGKAVLRQKRSLDVKCQAVKQLNSFNARKLYELGCYGNPEWKEERDSYGRGWDTSNDNQSWSYRDKHSEPYEGYMDTYDSGGYILNLGNSFSETIDIITSLRDNNWIDRATRAVLLEFSTYSSNTALFSVVTFIVEFPVSSSSLPSYDIQPIELINFTAESITPYFISQILLTLVLIYLFVMFVIKLKTQKYSYFKSFNNWAMLLLTSLTLASVLSYVVVLVVCSNAYDDYLHRRSGFTNMTAAAFWIREWKNINAVLLFVLMLLVVYQMRFIKFFARFIKTLQTAKYELLGMAFFFLAFLCYYAQLAYLWFGTVTYSMHSMGTSFMYTLSILRGRTPFLDSMMTYDHAFTACFYISFIFLMFVYVLGTIMAILNSAYKRVRMELFYHSTVETQDYEMVDFMMKRLKKWLKITKPKPAFRKVHFQDLPSVSSRESTAKSLRSLGPPGSITSVTSSDFSSLAGELDNQTYNRELVDRADETWKRMWRKLNDVENIDKEESKLARKLESHYKHEQKEQEKKMKELKRKRELRARRNEKQVIDTSVHDAVSSALSRTSDAHRARENWFSSPTEPKSPFKSAPKYKNHSPLDPDIIISKPPSGPPGIYQRNGENADSATYEPSFAAVGKGIGLSQFQKLGSKVSPAQPSGMVSPKPKQPLFSPQRAADVRPRDSVVSASRQSGDVNASTASVSQVVLSPEERPIHRRQSTSDLPWYPAGRQGRLYSTSSDALTPSSTLSASITERRRRRARSHEKTQAKLFGDPPERKAWDY